MRLPATLALVVQRARANPAPVVAVALNVLVVCTLVSALAASLTLLQREALRSALGVAPAEATVLTATSPYDDEDPAAQDSAMRAALDPVVSLVGGTVVGLAQSGTYDVQGARQGRPLAAITDAGDRWGLTQGRPPAPTTSGPLEVAAPADSPYGVGDELTLVNRSDDREVAAAVVGRWELPAGSERWLSGIDPQALLVAPERFADVAGTGTVARWRAVPEVTDLGPDQL
ncbi:MAG TPA: hypothetical protein VD814_08965, partial [Nocardioides sp.]|nr:hypothetical protein [Nocardioides sp.]